MTQKIDSNPMTKEDILEYVLSTHPKTVVNQTWGETGIFYNPENKLKKVCTC